MPIVRKNAIVEQFRADVDIWFVRYQEFYLLKNEQTRNYRMAHVDLITDIYNQLMTVFGDDIEAVRQSAYELNDLIDDRLAVLGNSNACLQEAIRGRDANSNVVGSTIQQCATYANTSLSFRLSNTFYPAHASIQRQISSLPVTVVDVLARGNVLQDEGLMIEYLSQIYAVKDLQWEGAVSQLLRWESNRWTVDGSFMVDEMTECMMENVINYINENVRIEALALSCA